MAERNDLRGPYKKLNLEEMSKEFLIKLLAEWQLQYAAFQEGLNAALLQRVTMDEFKSIMVEANTSMYEATMPRLNKLAGIEPKTFLDYNTAGFLSLDSAATKGYFESQEEVISPNHVISRVTRCPYLAAMEEAGTPELVRPICEDIEAALMPVYYQYAPGLKITPLKLPPRQSPADIACSFEFKIEE